MMPSPELDLPAGAARRRARDHPRRRADHPRGTRRLDLATLSVFVAFAGASPRSSPSVGEDPTTASELSTRVHLARAGRLPRRHADPRRPALAEMMLVVTGVGGLIVLYSIGYMAGEDEERRYFAYMALFVFSMLLLVQARQPAAAARRLGPRRPRLVPPDRLLPRAPRGDRRREEGVRHERGRRRGDGAGLLPADRARPARSTSRSRSTQRRRAISRTRPSTSSRSACSAARSPSRPRSRSTRGCPTRWRARPPSPR